MRRLGLNAVRLVDFRTTTATRGLDLSETSIEVLVLLPALHLRTREVQSLVPATLTVVITVRIDKLVKKFAPITFFLGRSRVKIKV